MSRQLRQQDFWPSNLYARYLWLIDGLWDEMIALSPIYNESADAVRRIAIGRHVLLDLHTMDALVREFQNYIRREEVRYLSAPGRELMDGSFRNYHRALQPRRPLLQKIRNVYGAHRTGVPWVKAAQWGVGAPNVWGDWEALLTQLERECDLAAWKDQLGAIPKLFGVLKDFNLAEWYTVTADGHFRPVFPLQRGAYLPRGRTDQKTG